jgi:hypothetical protein
MIVPRRLECLSPFRRARLSLAVAHRVGPRDSQWPLLQAPLGAVELAGVPRHRSRSCSPVVLSAEQAAGAVFRAVA